MKVQGNLRISINVDGHLGILEFRAVEEIAISSQTMEEWR